VRDILVAMLLPLAVALLLTVVTLFRLPEPYPDAGMLTTYTAAREAALVEYRADPDAFFAARRWVLFALLAFQSAGFVVAGWWFRRRRPVQDWSASIEPELSTPEAIRKGVAVGFWALLANIAVGLATLVVFGLEDLEQPVKEVLASMDGAALLGLLVLATVIGPVGEEVFFRGHLFRWSASRCGVRYAYVLTAVLFALLHGNPSGIPAYLVIAVIFGWSYARWRTLIVPITAHITLNTIAVLPIVLGALRS